MEKLENLFISEEEIKGIDTKLVLNVNIGVMGHIDSGKTSLVRELTRIVSTAALDKNPQSQERGITLDLGFSAFFTKFPEEKADSPFKYIQFTLVDCPGHASLIRTIIGGASIIDLMFLVVDINKGIQTQTAECFVIGELLIPQLLIVLNKIDLLPPDTRDSEIKKRSDELRQKFSKTRFGPNIPIIPVSANVGAKEELRSSENIDSLIKTLLTELRLPKRSPGGDFFFLIDHCFPIKGQGSVVTGTVISGGVIIGSDVEFPIINERKKVKSIQMFRKPIEKAFQGDRIGMLFAQLDNKLIERGIACQPGAVRLVDSLIINIQRIPYFKKEFPIKSKSKFHITSGHQTVMGTINLFRKRPADAAIKKEPIVEKDQEGKYSLEHKHYSEFTLNDEYEFYEELKAGPDPSRGQIYCFIEFEKPMFSNLGSFIIGSKLDMDVNSKNCRLAFHGNVLAFIKMGKEDDIDRLKVFKEKAKRGVIEKIIDNHTVLVKNLFKKETDLEFFKNKEFCMGNMVGKFHSTFGKSGKIKIAFDKNIYSTFKVPSQIASESKGEDKMMPPQEEFKEGDIEDVVLKTEVILKYKKYMFQKK